MTKHIITSSYIGFSLLAKKNHFGALLACVFALALAVAPAAHAIDGGLGRSISGAQIAPYQAVVPPEPGTFYVEAAETYYDGSIGVNKEFPIGQNLVVNMDASISFTTITLGYNWPTALQSWNFMSAIVVPLAYERITADVTLGDLPSRHIFDKASGIFDLMFRVAQASYHISPTAHLGFSLDVWAPTGDYNPANLANLSLNNWTFVPTVSFTQLFKNDFEFSALWALEYYTKNIQTDYHDGTLSRVEALVLDHINERFAIGVIGSWIVQLTKDTGTLADRLDGFEGVAYGLGPILTYTIKIQNKDVALSARWIHEFQNKNMLKGDVYSVAIGTKF